jgi:4-amino-4-deoxy-L-arabinose transferase-like glycosyltransferase
MVYRSQMVQESQHIQSPSAEKSLPFPTDSAVASLFDKAQLESSVRAKQEAAVDWQMVLIPSALFLLSAVILLFKLDQHPPFGYNWEPYTTWRFFSWWDHPTVAIFGINDGLMTDSGNAPMMALPMWVSMKVFGVGLFALRFPGAVFSAIAIPLAWLVGGRLVTPRAGLLSAILLALLPAFVLYGRTATDVAISLVPALMTIYFILRALKEPRRWRWLTLLQLTLIVSVYAYSPIRMLWPISIALFATEIAFHRGQRWRLAVACLVTIVVLPAFLVVFDQTPDLSPKVAISNYYYARGETAISWKGNPDLYKYYLKMTPKEQAAGHLIGSERQLMWRIVKQNGKNLENLYLDRGTGPAIIYFWSPQGRLYFTFLVPFFLIGLAKSVRGAFRNVEDRILQACFWGFSLPLLLSSNVHIGRLVYIFPIMMFFVASGFFTLIDFLVPRLRLPKVPRIPQVACWFSVTFLLLATARASWVDYRDLPMQVPSIQVAAHSVRIVAQLDADAKKIEKTGGNAVLVRAPGSLEVEQIDVSMYRLYLYNSYRFVDISAGAPSEAADIGKPSLLYGQVIGLLKKPEQIPSYCQNTYYVEPSSLPTFLQLTQTAPSLCGHPLRFAELAT